ncbi:MAG: hypothetical protein ACYS8X_03145 [Planctomycetota bacterium]|jgi:hypothetical protein
MSNTPQQSLHSAAEAETDLGFEVDPAPVFSGPAFGHRARRVTVTHAGKLTVSATAGCYVRGISIPAAGLALLLGGLMALTRPQTDAGMIWLLANSGLAILIIGVLLLIRWTKSTTLDRPSNRYWQGPWRSMVRLLGAEFGSLDDIAAVQLCAGHTAQSRTRGYSWQQINLVLKDPKADRIALMTHAHDPQLIEDAKLIADFLRVPLLDHTAKTSTQSSRRFRRAFRRR